jgi:hypothetical protein
MFSFLFKFLFCFEIIFFVRKKARRFAFWVKIALVAALCAVVVGGGIGAAVYFTTHG